MNVSPLSFRALNSQLLEKRPIEPIIKRNNKTEDYNIKKPYEYIYASPQKYELNIPPKHLDCSLDETTYEKNKNAVRFMAKRLQGIAKELKQMGLDTFEEYRQLIETKANGTTPIKDSSSFITYNSKDKTWSAARYQNEDSTKLIDFMTYDTKTATMRIFKMNNGSPIIFVFKDNALSRITRPETYDATYLAVEYDLDDDSNYRISLPKQNNHMHDLDPFSCEFRNDNLKSVTTRIEDYEYGTRIYKQTRYEF